MSPDPYSGSMDFGNPQSLNRYSYVANMPTGYTDPSGLEGGAATAPCGHLGSNPVADVGCGLFLVIDYLLYRGISGLFAHAKFTASHTPRPNYKPWDENEFPIHYGPNIAGALGLPTSGGCEFGACGGGPSAFQNGQGSGAGQAQVLDPDQSRLPALAQA